MTINLIEDGQTTTITGTHEEPVLKTIFLNEFFRSFVIDLGDLALVLDSTATGGGAVKNRLFVLNENNPSLVLGEHRIFSTSVEQIVFKNNSPTEETETSG